MGVMLWPPVGGQFFRFKAFGNGKTACEQHVQERESIRHIALHCWRPCMMISLAAWSAAHAPGSTSSQRSPTVVVRRFTRQPSPSTNAANHQAYRGATGYDVRAHTHMIAETYHTPHSSSPRCTRPPRPRRLCTPTRYMPCLRGLSLLSLGQACRPAPGVRCNDECVAGETRHRTGQHELSINSPLAGDGRQA